MDINSSRNSTGNNLLQTSNGGIIMKLTNVEFLSYMRSKNPKEAARYDALITELREIGRLKTSN